MAKSNELKKADQDDADTIVVNPAKIVMDDPEVRIVNAAKIVKADAVHAEEVPTIPLGSLQTIDALQPEVAIHPLTTTPGISIPAPLVAQPSEYRRSLDDWFHAWLNGIRPAYLPLALLPLLLGSILAWTRTVSAETPLGRFHFTHFLAAIVTVCLLQFGANLINDYYDYMRGVDTSNPLGTGGLIQQGLVRPMRVLIAGLVLLGVGAVLGLVVAAAGGPLVYLFGLIGLLFAYFYSAGKYSFSALGLGDVVGFCVFGPLMTLGAYMVQGQTPGPLAFLYSLPLGLWAAAVIHLNNMRDAEGDEQAGKRTLASILGLGWSRVWFFALLLGAYVAVLLLAVPHRTPHLLLISLWTLPGLVVVMSSVQRTDVPTNLHLAMRHLLKLEIWFAILFVVALIVSTLFPVFPLIPAALLHL
ncbi:MAG TPA: 1,4-dihydroxy-2-naphthoate octaprenyltransferase [Ktedonosporobacter sp.]|nr:1,4-dihydroxy-2-naphthoate octaprenyltransferase [Ktedonosporobacter sp.]